MAEVIESAVDRLRTTAGNEMHTGEEEEVLNDEQTENEINRGESFDLILHRVNDKFEENKEEYKSEE